MNQWNVTFKSSWSVHNFMVKYQTSQNQSNFSCYSTWSLLQSTKIEKESSWWNFYCVDWWTWCFDDQEIAITLQYFWMAWLSKLRTYHLDDCKHNGSSREILRKCQIKAWYKLNRLRTVQWLADCHYLAIKN